MKIPAYSLIGIISPSKAKLVKFSGWYCFKAL